MNHLIITRMNFTDDELFNHYFTVMKKTYIPSIESQENQNFQVGLIINPIHEKVVKPFLTEKYILFNNFDEVKKYCKEKQIIIQTRHDCDDWMRSDYIKKIQELYNENKDKHEKFIIHSRVQKLNFETKEIHEHATSYENNNFISMFLTLCQKDVEDFVYDKNHRFMHEITKNIFLIQGGYTRLVIHGKNILSKINPNDKKVSKQKPDLSIVVPTFENVEFLNSFLKSIDVAKKNLQIELMVGIDNCLKTKDFVHKNFEKFEDYVTFYMFDKNVGPYIIRNTLAKNSKSNNLLFVDSDDIVDKELLHKVSETLKKNKIVRFKFYNFVNENDLKIIEESNIHHFHSIGQLGIHKNIFLEMNGYEDWICSADSEFKMREEKKGIKTKYLNDVLYYRRRHDNSLTTKPETNQMSITRQTYYRMIKNRRNIHNYKKISQITVCGFSKFITKNKLKLVSEESNIKENNYEPKINHVIPKTKKPELTNKQIDYTKINQLFEKNSIKTNTLQSHPNNSLTKIKKNTDLLQNMLGKNKRKF